MRIVSMEELEEAEIVSYLEHVIAGASHPCCALAMVAANDGCDDMCVGSNGGYWEWHGTAGEAPSPESIWLEVIGSPRPLSCGHLCEDNPSFDAYRRAVHARAHALLEPFDEETERSRLVAIER